MEIRLTNDELAEMIEDYITRRGAFRDKDTAIYVINKKDASWSIELTADNYRVCLEADFAPYPNTAQPGGKVE